MFKFFTFILSLFTLMLGTSILNAQASLPDSRGKILASDGTSIMLSPAGGYIQKSLDVVEGIGKKGLEQYYNERLVSGSDLPTAINAALQKSTETILDEMKAELNATEVLAMVMDSKTGELLTIASSNRYDPLHIRGVDVPNLNPKFSEYPYEPGTVMQPITVASNLTTHLGERDKYKEVFNTDYKKLQIGKGLWIKDDTKHKSQTMTDILVSSSNIGTALIAWQIPGNGFHYFLNKFGFGQKSGIDLPRDLAGTIKSETLLQEKLHIANSAYGYGLMATPLQLLKAYSTFANGGWMVTPHIGSNNKYEAKEVLPKPTARKVKQMLTEVVKRGTGKQAQTEGLIIGGKTGTAHIAKNGRYVDDYHSSFYGFAEDSTGQSYTIGVLVIEPKAESRHYASQSAVPVFKKVVDVMVKNELLTPLVKNDDMSIVGKRQKQLELLRQRLNIRQNKANVSSYKGEKTISPLIGGKAIKHFGMYIDPVYDIKIFNESVTLKSEKSNAKVYCVSDGKVVFVGKSKMLGKVVVMAHENSLHTVYAGLSKIAPTVRVGEKLGSAYILGRVKEKLIFQVTQDGNFVDPMDVIEKKRSKMLYIKKCDFNEDGISDYRLENHVKRGVISKDDAIKEIKCMIKELKRTIAPLAWSKLVQPYGAYTDKKTGKEVFRKYITLVSANKNAKVYNVLDGKVLYVGENDKYNAPFFLDQ